MKLFKIEGEMIKKVGLGRTNLTVTKLGWGSIPIQRVNDEAEAVSVIKAVIEMGVNFLDTSRAYTTSECQIGLALQGVKEPVVLSSRSFVKTEKIYDDVHISLKQFKVKKIDLYHIHNVSNFEDYKKVISPGGAYEGLRRAQDEGLIDHIGITGHNLDLMERVIEDGYFDTIMVCYSFLEPKASEKIFPLAKAKDVGVIAMKPFSGGAIEDAGPALRYVLSAPDIVVIPGVESLEKARENWEIFSKGNSLTEGDWNQIEALRKEFNFQFCRRCDYCQPCSEDIDIQFILGLKSFIKRVGPRRAHELGWPVTLIAKARNCSECGDCIPRCPYGLPIPDLIKKNLTWYDSLE